MLSCKASNFALSPPPALLALMMRNKKFQTYLLSRKVTALPFLSYCKKHHIYVIHSIVSSDLPSYRFAISPTAQLPALVSTHNHFAPQQGLVSSTPRHAFSSIYGLGSLLSALPVTTGPSYHCVYEYSCIQAKAKADRDRHTHTHT